MHYLSWRIAEGLNKTIEMNFLVAGHTKFTCDMCFGMVKKKYRRTRVSCLDDIAKVRSHHFQVITRRKFNL